MRYTYKGPIEIDGETKNWIVTTKAPTVAKALNNIKYNVCDKDKYLISTCKLDKNCLSTDKIIPPKPKKPKFNNNVCDICGHILSDDGTCPNCFDVYTDFNE